MQDLKKKLEEEIAALDMELRVDLPREISKARAHGDLSENAEYHAAKERQGMVNARLGQRACVSCRCSISPGFRATG
jgi:transcription elongation factor GreA